MHKGRFFWSLLYVIMLILPGIIFTISTLQINSSGPPLYILSGLAGTIAYSIFMLQFVIASRPKFIEKSFGLDKMYRFHMTMAVAAIILAIIHNLLKGMYFKDSSQTTIGTISIYIFGVIIVISSLMMINRLFFKFTPVDTIRNLLKKSLNIKYNWLINIHNITVLGLIFLFVHVLIASSVSEDFLLQLVMIAYFAVPMIMYFYHKIIKPTLADKKYTVSEVISDSDSILTLKLVSDNKKLFDYIPGQFLYIRMKNKRIPKDEHPFSISSSPHQKEYIAVTVKELGDFTSSLPVSKPGDKAYIDGAFGRFSHVLHENTSSLCFIAGGIGVTPFLSMLRYMKAVGEKREVLLLWGVANQQEIICNEELLEIEKSLGNFKLIPVVSSEDNYSGEKGYIDGPKIKRLLNENLKRDFYLCGPPIMLELVVKALSSMGVPSKNIFFEQFSL